MKSFPSRLVPYAMRSACATAAVAAVCAMGVDARADLPAWMQYTVAGSTMENALYRLMSLPGVRVLYPRPPAEARDQINGLLQSKPDDAELYALRAHVEEQALDFTAAEADWQAFAEHAPDKVTGELQLADFYKRRVNGPQEIAALEAAAAQPSSVTEKFRPADQQQAWEAFVRALAVASDDALGDDATIAISRAWIARYPAEPVARANFLGALLKMKRYADAMQAISDYQAAFPQDKVFPIKATALLALQQGDANASAQALALFDAQYQPLWPPELIDSYFQLLNAAHTQHAMLTAARAQLAAHPDDLNAVTRVFYYYQRGGRADAAANALAEYSANKQTRHAAWTPDELYTFATLLERTSQSEEAARYDFALASTSGSLSGTAEKPEEAGLAGLVRLLLNAPQSGIQLGAGNLSIYRDIATLDNGPGYLNGVLSLWLNSQSPAQEMSAEEQKATLYFHRAKAAELLTVLDQKYPASTERPSLHAALIRAYAGYGQDDAVKQEGTTFLADFPQANERLEMALEVADADAHSNDAKDEFALYDSLLAELAAQLQGMPLTAAGVPTASVPAAAPADANAQTSDDASPDASPDTSDNSAATDGSIPPTPAAPAAKDVLVQALAVPVNTPSTNAAATAYKQLLERYLGRLTMTGHGPEALAVLRKELDRNPNDPQLYERLAEFLQQNNLGAQEEEVYEKAIAKFNDESFYDKLARYYLRAKREQSYAALSRKVVNTFHGTELEAYFADVKGPWALESVQLNLYAHKRFPHDLTFTRNLLQAYQAKGTANPAAWEQLIRQHWQDASDLQAQFFEWLGRTNRLNAEVASLKLLAGTKTAQQRDPAAAREMAELEMSRSHFEQSAPLFDELATTYPADVAIGDEAASLFRSLAYNDPAQIARAVAVEKNLSAADPGNLDRLAVIGDTYADSTSSELNLDTSAQLSQAAPYWQQMAAVHPGVADGYLQSATVFWDYFQFDAALNEIAAARTKLNKPAMYGYEAGAIYENKGDMEHAIAEYAAAALRGSTNDGGASDRLAALAGRAATADAVDKTTTALLAQHPTVAALELRASVLAAQHHSAQLGPLVTAAVARATMVDQVMQLADFSQKHQLTQAYEAALLREIALAVDPVECIELQYQLMHAYDDAGDTANAQKIVELVYKDNPAIVGVVRTTVDFYWSHKQQPHAVTVLVQASRQANSQLALAFTLEAISKSNQSGDYRTARTLLQPLLASEPYSAKYIGLQADSFAAAKDNAGLRDFYANLLKSIAAAPLSAADKRDKTAMARQGMIVALTNLKDYAGAEDQHIALIRAFPEDSNILQAAASYARQHGREAQLVGFLNTTVAASPQDSRFAIDLAQVDAMFEDYDGALAAYTKAIAIRKDRADLYIARADIEEHQQAFDAACADYERLYVLSYKDSQWMEKEALARARQGRADLAVKALQAAWIDGQPPTAGNYFKVADQLQNWDMLDQAQTFLDLGMKLAGDDLLRDSQYDGDANIYAQILGRERRSGDALTTLAHLYSLGGGSASAPGVIIQQVETHGIASVTDADWRKALVARRQQQAEKSFEKSVQELSQTAATYYTPEEKLAYAKVLDAQRANRPAQEVVEVWIPAAHSADLKDREATWRSDVLLAGGDLGKAQLNDYDTLELARMDYTPLAQTLDKYAATLKPADQLTVLQMAADAWRDAANAAAQTNDLRLLTVSHNQAQNQDAFFALLLQADAAKLLALASGKDATAAAAANYLVAHGTESQALAAVAAFAKSQKPVWGSANKALVGLYFGDASAPIDAAFEDALADRTIAERLATKPDADKQLTGNTWFYYGMRYGVLLTLPAQLSQSPRDPEDFLASQLELEHGSSTNYFELALAYADAHKYDAAITEYRHAEEIDGDDATPNVAIAETLCTEGKQADAVAEWNHALTKLRATVDVQAVPESFWTNFAAIAQDAHDRGLGEKLKPAMDTVLVAYIHKNADYRTMELLQSATLALGKPGAAEAASWVLALIGNAPSDTQQTLLAGLAGASWFPQMQLDAVYTREIALIKAAPADPNTTTASDDTGSLSEVAQVQVRYIRWLLKNGKTAQAQTVMNGLPKSAQVSGEVQALRIQLAAKLSQLTALVAIYQQDATQAPSLDSIGIAANQLRMAGDHADSRMLLEYVFQQKLQQQALVATDYLALAEERLATNDIAGALDLLNRMTFQGDLYENLDSAASLLMNTGHPAEALPLLTRLAKGVPWGQHYALRLAQAQLALKQNAAATPELIAVASTKNAGYVTRVEAAQALHVAGSPHPFDSAELTLLAGGTATPEQANQPYFVYARIEAAGTALVAQRGDLYRAALLVAPDSIHDWLRLQVFDSAMAAKDYKQASVAIEPLIASNAWMRAATAPAEDNTDSMDATTDTAAAFVPSTPDPYALTTVFQTDAQRTSFALALDEMDEALGKPELAQQDLQMARRLTTDATQKAALTTRLKAIEQHIANEQENANRRPVIQTSLDQQVVVRPRLVAETGEVQP